MVARKTCFFIDDDADNLMVFRRALNHVSPETICFVASTAEDALALMIEEEIVPSCIFVQEYLRGMSADEFLLFIRQSSLLKDVPVIVHGTDIPTGRVNELLALGALAIYTRPLTFLGVCNMLNLYFRPEMASIGKN
jgi:response regulator of citrate/malate metabolism